MEGPDFKLLLTEKVWRAVGGSCSWILESKLSRESSPVGGCHWFFRSLRTILFWTCSEYSEKGIHSRNSTLYLQCGIENAQTVSWRQGINDSVNCWMYSDFGISGKSPRKRRNTKLKLRLPSFVGCIIYGSGKTNIPTAQFVVRVTFLKPKSYWCTN